jgi:RNA-directed DNA polymerase
MRPLAQQVRSPDTLSRAWRIVFENSRTSASYTTRAAVADFAPHADKHLRRIKRQLAAGVFRFAPAKGVLAVKKSGSLRPVVVAPIESRIVQRAILDVVQGIPEIREKLNRRRNFGGIAKVGVPDAVKEAYAAAKATRDFIRTDVKDFFVKIPREQAVCAITNHSRQDDFDDLLRRATETELENIAAISRHRELFPLEGIGVAQGCCLSPLLANLLLEEFDEQMNSRGIRCIRYIDDFILFALSRRKALAALDSAQWMLGQFGLTCYEPGVHGKAEIGKCDAGFEFLGCHIRLGRVRPGRRTQRELFKKVREQFDQSLRHVGQPDKAWEREVSFVDTLSRVNRMITGWANTYAFCSDDSLFASMDQEIGKAVTAFERRYRRAAAAAGVNDVRDLLGVGRIARAHKDVAFREFVQADDASPSARSDGARPSLALTPPRSIDDAELMEA